MKNQTGLSLFSALLFLCGCHNAPPQEHSVYPMVLHLEVDSAGAITNPEALRALTALAARVDTMSERVMITGYSEQTGDSLTNFRIAQEEARTAREYLRKISGKGYNLGMDAAGFLRDEKASSDEDMTNRRVVITPIE